MKVIHVAAVKGIAGSEGHLLKLLPGLKAAGIDVEMRVLGSPDKTAKFIHQMEGLNIPIKGLELRGDFAPRLVWQLASEFQVAHPDIVHTHLIHAETYAAVAARIAGVSHVVTSRHNIDRFRTWILFRAASFIMWKLIDRGITISDAVKVFTEGVEPSSQGKLQTIYYGLGTLPESLNSSQRRDALCQRLGIEPNGTIIGTICRLIEQKGLRYALAAFAKIRKQVPTAHYVIAGDGTLRQKLVDQAEQLGLNGYVHFLGWHDRVDELYDAFDVFLLPSLWEGFGLVLLEAMSHGLPVVTTNTSAMPEIVVDGETGYLVHPADSEALVEPLVRLLRDRNVAQKMGGAGRKRLETVFTVEKMVNETAAFYRGVVQGAKT